MKIRKEEEWRKIFREQELLNAPNVVMQRKYNIPRKTYYENKKRFYEAKNDSEKVGQKEQSVKNQTKSICLSKSCDKSKKKLTNEISNDFIKVESEERPIKNQAKITFPNGLMIEVNW